MPPLLPTKLRTSCDDLLAKFAKSRKVFAKAIASAISLDLELISAICREEKSASFSSAISANARAAKYSAHLAFLKSS